MKLKKSISSSLALCLIASSMSFIGSTNVASAASKLIGTTKAKQIMLKKVPNGKFTEFKLDNDRTPTYEAELTKGSYEYDITVDAKTGKILEFEKEKSKMASKKLISEKKAKQIMLKKVPNGKFIEFELDKDSTPTYEAELTKGNYEYEISVDARTGKILKYEKEKIKTIAVKSLKLNAKSATIQKGKTKTLKATVAPTNATVKTVKWKSSNTKIATVNSKGVVKGIKAGTVTITATSSNGKKATCKITVKNAKVVGEKKAKEVVLDRVPGAKFISFEFDNDYTPSYEVEVTKGNYKYEISIDAITGEIIGFEKERYKSSSSSSKLVSASEAKQIMLDRVPGARLIEFEFDNDDYIPTYQGTLRKGIYEYEITVNAKTGKIIEFEKDID